MQDVRKLNKNVSSRSTKGKKLCTGYKMQIVFIHLYKKKHTLSNFSILHD